MQQGEGDDAAELKESPQDFALWKAHKEGEDTAWPVALGRGPARAGTSSARRWPSSCSAPTSRSTAAGRTWCSPTTRTRSPRPRRRATRPLARIWMHNGMVQMGAEKMAKSVGNIRLLHQALEEYGRDALVMYFARGHYRQPLAFSPEALEEAGPGGRAAARAGRPARPRRRRSRRAWTRTPSGSSTGSPTTSTPPRRWACCSSGCREANRRLDAGEAHGPGPARRDAPRARPGEPARGGGGRRPTRGAAPAGGARGGPGREGLRARRPRSATSWPRSARRCATRPEGAAAAAPGVIVYGRNPVREAPARAVRGR